MVLIVSGRGIGVRHGNWTFLVRRVGLAGFLSRQILFAGLVELLLLFNDSGPGVLVDVDQCLRPVALCEPGRSYNVEPLFLSVAHFGGIFLVVFPGGNDVGDGIDNAVLLEGTQVADEVLDAVGCVVANIDMAADNDVETFKGTMDGAVWCSIGNGGSGGVVGSAV